MVHDVVAIVERCLVLAVVYAVVRMAIVGASAAWVDEDMLAPIPEHQKEGHEREWQHEHPQGCRRRYSRQSNEDGPRIEEAGRQRRREQSVPGAAKAAR
eukprot:scaffold1223_cov380-Prasinococcus_capsulatus_cf.AAC.2